MVPIAYEYMGLPVAVAGNAAERETLVRGYASSTDIRGGDMPCRDTGRFGESIARILRHRLGS